VAFLGALGEAAAGRNVLGAAFAAQAQGGAAQLQIYDILFDEAGNLVGLKPLIAPVPVQSNLLVPEPPASGPSANPPSPAPVTALPGRSVR
jgi:hypothetical protein